MANYKDWIDAIEIKVDYFAAFMKAWIAFNAWYNSEISEKTDRANIDIISNKTNRFRTYMNNLLSEETPDGISYRENVALLHASLLSAAITTEEYVGIRQSISFSEVAVKNQNNHSKKEYRTYRYECVRTNAKVITSIVHKTKGIELFNLEQDEHNVSVLRQQAAFTSLSDTQKEKCLECYDELKPYKTETILDTSEAAKKFGAYSFVNDDNRISRAIIMILYLLRCALAHGDISPDAQANNVYRYAYEVLVPPLKKLQ